MIADFFIRQVANDAYDLILERPRSTREVHAELDVNLAVVTAAVVYLFATGRIQGDPNPLEEVNPVEAVAGPDIQWSAVKQAE